MPAPSWQSRTRSRSDRRRSAGNSPSVAVVWKPSVTLIRLTRRFDDDAAHRTNPRDVLLQSQPPAASPATADTRLPG